MSNDHKIWLIKTINTYNLKAKNSPNPTRIFNLEQVLTYFTKPEQMLGYMLNHILKESKCFPE